MGTRIRVTTGVGRLEIAVIGPIRWTGIVWGAGYVQAFGHCFQRDRLGPAARWLHQMRPDLGRLAAIAESLQVGPSLGSGATRGAAPAAVIWCGQNSGSIRMKIFRAAALIALLAGPAYAQSPNINLMPELASKTPEQKEADAIKEKAYRESLKKIPDAKG